MCHLTEMRKLCVFRATVGIVAPCAVTAPFYRAIAHSGGDLLDCHDAEWSWLELRLSRRPVESALQWESQKSTIECSILSRCSCFHLQAAFGFDGRDTPCATNYCSCWPPWWNAAYFAQPFGQGTVMQPITTLATPKSFFLVSCAISVSYNREPPRT